MSQGAQPVERSRLSRGDAAVRARTSSARSRRDRRRAREQMMWAATLAGIAFGNAGVHVPHAMAYAIAGRVRDVRPPGYPDGAARAARHGGRGRRAGGVPRIRATLARAPPRGRRAARRDARDARRSASSRRVIRSCARSASRTASAASATPRADIAGARRRVRCRSSACSRTRRASRRRALAELFDGALRYW